MALDLEKHLLTTVNKSLSKEIKSEYTRKIKSYWKLREDHSDDYSWISDNDLILNLILLSVYYRRVIHPMDETEKFYKLINDSALYPEFQEKNQIFFDFLPRKIKIGVTEINHGSNINDIDIDISELHEIVEDFYSLLRIFDIPPNLLFYKSMDDFLHNLKPMLGVQR